MWGKQEPRITPWVLHLREEANVGALYCGWEVLAQSGI